MKGLEIVEFCKNNVLLQNHFGGIFGSEKANTVKELPAKTFAIINTDQAGEEGLHWYCAINVEKA